MIKAIFFDSGNVLVREGYTPGIAEYEEKYGIKKGKLYASAHDRTYWKDFTLGNITEDEYFRQLKNDFVGELNIPALKEIIYKNFISNDELLDYIKTLKGKFILGIISNNPKELFEYCLNTFGWNDVFAVKAVSSYLHVRKPDEEIFQQALELAKIKGNEAIYVDDRTDRVSGAKEADMNTLIYNNVHKLKSVFKKLSNFQSRI